MLIDAEPLPGYPEPYDLLCAVLQDGTNEWRWELDPNLSEDAVVWQPEPGMHSIGGTILHIVAVEIFWFERFALGLTPDPEERKLLMADETDVDEWRWPVPPRKPISWYFELHDRIRTRTLESIKKWPPADAAIEWDGKPRTLRWVLGHVIQHEAYHGGQAVLLNRLWDLKQTPSAPAPNPGNGSAEGEWAGFYFMEQGKYPISLSLHSEGEILHGTMVDERTTWTETIKEVIRTLPGNAADPRAWADFAAQYPDATMTTRIPANSTLRGKQSRETVQFTKVYEGLQEIIWSEPYPDNAEAHEMPPIEYVGKLNRDGTEMWGTWSIPAPPILGLVKRSVASGTFQLTRTS